MLRQFDSLVLGKETEATRRSDTDVVVILSQLLFVSPALGARLRESQPDPVATGACLLLLYAVACMLRA